MSGSREKPRLLFGAYMAGGNATILQNLQDQIGGRPDVDSDWLRIEMDRDSRSLGRTPRRPLIPGTLRNSLVTGREIGKLEASGCRFEAAWFFQQTICMFLRGFRSRVPYAVAMDGTPLWFLRNELWYALPRFDPRSLGSRVKHELTRRVYDGAAHLMPLSWSCRASLIEEYGIEPERISVIPPGIDVRRYTPPDRARRGDERPFRLLFIGADFLRKGGDLLVALAQAPEFRDLQFDLVTRSYRGPTADNIHVHDHVTPNSPRMLTLLREADLYALPTRADSHAIATLEAMAMGLPVVTTPVGGVVDVVRDGENGLFVPRNDADALGDRIRRLLRDRALRLRLGQAARTTVETKFNAASVSAQVVDLLLRARTARR